MSKTRETLKELRNLKEEALQAKLLELRERVRDLNFKTRSDEVKDVHALRKVRKEVAQVLTVLAEKSKINR